MGAEVAKFKLFADAKKASDEYISVSVSYKAGEITKVAVINLYYDDLFFTCDGVNAETGEFDFDKDNREFTAIISLPTEFNSSTTNGQVLDEDQFAWKDVQSVGAYFTYYMEIEGVPTATTLSISFKLN